MAPEFHIASDKADANFVRPVEKVIEIIPRHRSELLGIVPIQ